MKPVLVTASDDPHQLSQTHVAVVRRIVDRDNPLDVELEPVNALDQVGDIGTD